jgi:hypothetical protein
VWSDHAEDSTILQKVDQPEHTDASSWREGQFGCAWLNAKRAAESCEGQCSGGEVQTLLARNLMRFPLTQPIHFGAVRFLPRLLAFGTGRLERQLEVFSV